MSKMTLICGTPLGGWRDSGELELTEQVVVPGSGSLSLVDLDQHTGLVVLVGTEDLLLLGWHGGVSWDEDGHDASSGLQTEVERGDVQEQQVLNLLTRVSGENG